MTNSATPAGLLTQRRHKQEMKLLGVHMIEARSGFIKTRILHMKTAHSNGAHQTYP